MLQIDDLIEPRPEQIVRTRRLGKLFTADDIPDARLRGNGVYESAPSRDPFRRRMLTLPYRPIIVCAECLSNRAPGSLLETDWGVKRHAD